MLDDRLPPNAELVSGRRCDFTGLLAAVHELIGTEVTLWFMRASCEGHRPLCRLDGRVSAHELGREPNAAVCVKVGEADLLLSPSLVTGGYRDEYRSGRTGERWLVVWVELASGVAYELEQLLVEE